MSTVVRVFASTPARSASDTWRAIVDLLTRGGRHADRDELLGVLGVAASLITDHAPEDAAIVVTCDGPRTRIRCIYDDDAIDGSDASEAPLAHDPLKGDWAVSLPCPADDLDWVRRQLERTSARVTARDRSEELAPAASSASAGAFTIDPKGFLAS